MDEVKELLKIPEGTSTTKTYSLLTKDIFDVKEMGKELAYREQKKNITDAEVLHRAIRKFYAEVFPASKE